MLASLRSLSVPDLEVRKSSVLVLVESLEKRPDEIPIALERLLKGLLSSSSCARQGFCVALSKVTVVFFFSNFFF